MGRDISKKMIALLLVLAIILSASLTLISLTSAQPKAEPVTENTQGAEIRVRVVEPPEPVEAQIKVKVVEGK